MIGLARPSRGLLLAGNPLRPVRPWSVSMADEKITQGKILTHNFGFAMSEDGMKLGVSRYFPAHRRPGAFRGTSSASRFAEAGVRFTRGRGTPPSGWWRPSVTTAPTPASPWCAACRPEETQGTGAIIALGDLDYPVLSPGPVSPRYSPPRTARPGETIDGRSLPTEKKFHARRRRSNRGRQTWDPGTRPRIPTSSRVWGMAPPLRAA